MKYKPYPYQEKAKQWIIDHPAAGLFLGCGLGKTVITLTALAELKPTKALVIAPLRVAATVWAEEAQKWDHLKHLRVVKVLGSQAERLQALRQDADIYVINRENTEWLVNQCQKERRWPFEVVVLDELSSFKSAKAARFKALRRVRPAMGRVIGLTGTPAPNGLIDLWAQIYLLDEGERLHHTLGAYRMRYFDPGRRNGNIVYDWRPKPGAEEAIYEKLTDICISMQARDYLELPDRLDRTIKVTLEPKAQRAYERMEKDMLLPLQDQVITAASAAVVTGKLLQLANGAIYDAEHDYHVIHDAKIGALEDIVEAANGQPVLVYYSYQHDLQRIKERFPQAVQLATADDVARWNRGQIPILLAHPDSAGHGLNLQHGGHILVWFGLTWSLEKYQQANARLHRQGQGQPVTVYHIVADGTMDEQVMQILERKDQRQNALIEAVKARL